MSPGKDKVMWDTLSNWRIHIRDNAEMNAYRVDSDADLRVEGVYGRV